MDKQRFDGCNNWLFDFEYEFNKQKGIFNENIEVNGFLKL